MKLTIQNPILNSSSSSFWLPTLILLLCVLVRLPGLSDSFYGDEAFSLLRDSSELIPSSEDRFRPVFFSLLYLWRQIGFSGEIGLRLLPLIFGILQIPLAFFIGKKLHSIRAGVVFALLVATSPLLIEFSQELRMYSLVTFFALLQWWIYLRWRDESSWKWTGWFGIVALLGVYTHLHYWLYLAGFALVLWTERMRIPLRMSVAGLGAVLLLYLPNIRHVLRFTHDRGESYAMDLTSALPKLAAAFTVGYNYFRLPDTGVVREIGKSVFSENVVLIPIAAIPILILTWQIVRLHTQASERVSLLIPHLLFTLPIALALVAAVLTQKNWLQPKYLIFSAPAGLWFFTLGYVSLSSRVMKLTTIVCGGLVLAVALWHFNDPVHYGRREDWRGAAQILSHSMGADAALVITDGAWGLLEYYGPDLRKYWMEVGEPKSYATEAVLLDTLRVRLIGRSRAYYLRVDTFQNTVDPDDRLLRVMDALGRRTVMRQLNPRLHLFVWEVP